MVPRHRFWLVSGLLLLATLACGVPSFTPTSPTMDNNMVGTLAAQTVAAEFTEQAMLSTTQAPVESATSLVPEATNPPTNTLVPPTPVPTDTPAPTFTAVPTDTPVPTATPIPTATPLPTATQIPCLLAQFIKDVTIPDGTVFPPGSSFTKIWRVKNTGSCTWTRDYSLVFARGDRLSGETTAFPHNVQPGETVDLAVNMVAPIPEDDYSGYWLMSNGSQQFGVGADGRTSLFVSISVEQKVIKQGIVYSFAENFCAAKWSSGAGRLSCPGLQGSTDGFVVLLTDPKLENRNENELTLWTSPEQVKNGYITGEFPPVTIKAGDVFLADIGCLADSPRCDIQFNLSYRVGNNNIEKLGEWNEVFDDSITRIDIDLTSLDGKSVVFYLTVSANGPYREDNAFWLLPQIYRP